MPQQKSIPAVQPSAATRLALPEAARHAEKLEALHFHHGKDRAQRRQVVIANLAQIFGDRARNPVGYYERSWLEEEWSRGCYGCHMPTGAWTNYGPALREPIGPLHWAGAEYATVWNGYMDGAVRSGEESARAALGRL